MSRDRPFDDFPDSVDDCAGELPSFGGSAPIPERTGLLLVVLAGLALAWYARPVSNRSSTASTPPPDSCSSRFSRSPYWFS